MSFTSEFEQLYKEKKERDAQKAQSMIGLFNAYSQELAAKQSQDTSDDTGIFKASKVFDDGWQFGDVTKVILGTAGEAAVDVGQGFVGFSEGIADWIGHNVIYPFARATGQTENDLKWYRKAVTDSTTQQIFGDIDSALDYASILGSTSDAFMQGVGQYIAAKPAYVLGGPALGNTLLGMSTMGNAQSEAYASGATDSEAFIYGGVSAVTELLTEKLFGGLGKGINATGFNKGALPLDDLTAKAVSKLFKSQTGKNVAEYVTKMGFEGIEEAIAGYVSAHAKKGTFKSEEDFAKILEDEKLFEQFIVGALVSGVAQAGDVRIANKTGTDFVTGLTRNEQAVVDKEVENRIKQEQKGGKKLSGKEKSAIYEQVVKDMERGYISTETIESVLGKDALTQYDALSKEAEEFKTLYETEGGKLSEKQKDRLAELKEKNKANPYEQLLKSQRDKISKDVSTLAQNDRLGESYREQTRKNEKFQADVSKYSEAQRKTVQNAIDSGILNNTNRSHEFVDLIAKISADKGISFDFADNAKLKESGFALDGVLVNGFVNENGVTINVQCAKALNRVVGHEITHVLEGTELYNALQSAVTEYAKGKKEYDSRLKELTELYKGKNANVKQELVADLVGDYLFTDADFIRHLSTENRNLFQKIYDEIKYLCKIVTAGTKEARQLEKVKKAFADAYRAETKNPTAEGGVKYSIVNLDTGKSYVQASRQVIRGNSVAEWRAQISEFFNRALKNGPIEIETIEGDMLTISKNTAEKARSKTATENGISRELTDKEFLVKLHAEAHIDELAEISHKSKRPPVPDGKKHSFAKDGFTYRTVYFQDFDGSYYRITLSVGENNGISTVYNVGKIKADDIPDGKIISTIGSKADMSSTKFSISSEDENVKQKNAVYLDAVSRGDMQAAQQMVDEAAKAAGYDRRMFHETDAENIHIFDISRGDHGATDYETPYGIFTKTSDKNIGLGSRQIALYVKAQKTLYVEDRADVLNIIPGFVRYYDQIQEIDQRYNARAEELEDLEFEALGEWVQEHPEADMDEVYPTSYIIDHKPAKIDSLKYQEAFRQYEVNRQAWEKEYGEVAVKAKEFLTEYLRDNNYDSMYFRIDGGSRGRETDSLIVLNQNQVKSADPVTYDDKGEIIPITRRFDTSKTDIRYSLSKKDFSIAPPVGADVHGKDIGYDIAPPIPESVPRTNMARPKVGDPAYAPIAEKYLPKVNPEDSTGAAPSGFDPVSHLQYEYGSLPEGEKPVREDSLPKSTNGKDKVSLTGRTVKGAEATPDALVDLLDKTVVEGGLSYIPLSNDATVQKAYDRIKNLGWEEALEDWKADVRAGKVSAELSATGALLLNNAANAGDRAVWLDVLHEYQRMGTSAAQAVQALRILKTLAPEDKLYMIHKSVDQMNRDSGYDVEVDEDLLHEWDEAETDAERDEVLDAIMQNVADQIPASFMEKFTALRYVNMLGNLRTQVRNVAGNLSMKGVRSIHNTIATGLEAIANTVSGGKTGRTRAVTVSQEQKAAAKQDFEKLKSVILDGGKYSDSVDASTEFAKGVQEKRKIFKFKPLEGYRKATNWAMEQGDLIFARDAYARALAGYLKANGITETDYSKIDTKVLENARLFAIKEAQEATFRDTNALSGWISKVGRRRDTHKVGKLISEGVMPFRKTPANVLIRAEEYSPLGVINSVYYSVKAMQKGTDITATQVINSWAKSLTGTGLFALGMVLQSLGCLAGGADDDESKDKFDSMNGWQNYAIVLPDGTNLTIDFLTPTAMPMLMGAELSQLMADDGFELKDLESALTSITEPMVQMSMLQGINDTLDNVKYSDNSLMQMAINSGLSYVTQGLTNTLLGQVERAFEDSRTTTYVDKDSAVPDWLQRTLGKVSAKIPIIWDYNQIPYINAWGEEEEYGNVASNLAYNMLSPSYVDKGKEDAVSKELLRLNEVQSENVFPNTPAKSLSFTDVNNEPHKNYQLSAEKYVALAKTQGQKQRELVEAAIATTEYGLLSDTEKATVIKNIYKYAKEYARGEVIEGYADDYGCFSSKWMSEIYGDVAEEIIWHTIDQRN